MSDHGQCQCGRPVNSRGISCCVMCTLTWPDYGDQAQHTKKCKQANGPAIPIKRGVTR